jgi:shikimate kinase
LRILRPTFYNASWFNLPPVNERMSQRRRQIYLVGFMGSGKSSVGALLAQDLGWQFIDLDSVIEAGQKASIREIFDHAGEAFFRQLEAAALAEICKAEPAVLALGGGTFAQESNAELIRKTGGATVWLDCPAEELWQRCEAMQNRPLFRDRRSFSLLLEQRVPYYRRAEYRIPTGGRSAEEVARDIVRLKLF